MPQLLRGIGAGQTAYLISKKVSRENGTGMHVHSNRRTQGFLSTEHEAV
jgi:hypothetical protein